jgi:hypothetical protein
VSDFRRSISFRRTALLHSIVPAYHRARQDTQAFKNVAGFHLRYLPKQIASGQASFEDFGRGENPVLHVSLFHTGNHVVLGSMHPNDCSWHISQAAQRSSGQCQITEFVHIRALRLSKLCGGCITFLTLDPSNLCMQSCRDWIDLSFFAEVRPVPARMVLENLLSRSGKTIRLQSSGSLAMT